MTILDNVYYVVYITMLVALVYGIDPDQQPTLWQLGIIDETRTGAHVVGLVEMRRGRVWQLQRGVDRVEIGDKVGGGSRRTRIRVEMTVRGGVE